MTWPVHAMAPDAIEMSMKKCCKKGIALQGVHTLGTIPARATGAEPRDRHRLPARAEARCSLSDVATVQGNGNLLAGKSYIAMRDLKPGDEFEIKLGRKQVRLIPVGGVDEEE